MRPLPLLLLLTATAPAAAHPGPAQDEAVREVFEESCIECHDSVLTEGGFDLEFLFDVERPVTQLFAWRKARAMVEIGAMPPRQKLDADARRTLLGFFDSLETRALAEGGAPGYEPLRRLTRAELQNSLRDLLGVHVDLAPLLPGELVAEGGFTANSKTLFVHPDWLERAGSAVRLALLEALPDRGKASLRGAPEAVLERVMRGAYRRPLTGAELSEALARFAKLEETRPRRAALREALAAVLSSPHFLMRAEGTQTEAGPISDHALASRLSFFLWASGPDETLLDLADAGRLGDARVLEAQVARMLADERALALGELFAGQWLGTDALGTLVKPDPIDVPFMTDSVMAAMRAEVARFVLELIREDRPATALLDARFSFVNEELARFYGIKGVRGDTLRRVDTVPAERRGLLGKAGILATTSYPDRTSPVLRGNWVLTDLLGTPPPPPPPGASEFDEDLDEELEDASQRARLELHRSRAACASCHDRIDPLGFALEGFDRYGRSRRRDDEGNRVDTRGKLPNGATFRGPEGLAKVLVKHHMNDITKQAARRLLAYALARPLTWEDERTVADLAATLEEKGWGALVRAVVDSKPFRHQEPTR